MRVLVTRPLGDSAETAARLALLGHDSVIAPLLEIRYRDGGEIALDGVHAILATSANGIRALVRRTARRDVTLFAVGRQSAEEARLAGFADVRNAEGGSTALATAVAASADPHGETLLHVSGNDIAGDLQGTLEAAGFVVRREILYEAAAVPALPAEALAALRADTLDAVLLFSARSAATFAVCVALAGLQQTCRRLLAIAISPACAAPLASLPFREVRIAAAPNQDAMLDRLAG